MEGRRPPAVGEAGSIPELSFRVQDAGTLEHAAVPTLRFAVRIDAAGGEAIRSVMLETQIQIAARRRSYDDETEDRLFELFGEPERWADTLRTLLWTRTTQVVPPFEGSTVVDLHVPCTYDFDVTATRYLDGVRDGEVPLELLFGGTFFYPGADGRLQIARIGWEQEAEYRLPAGVWRETMDRHFPGTAWLRLRRDTFDRLHAYRSDGALLSWEDAIESLLARAGEGT
jgi:Family of unknown function (DUF6084)